MRLCGIDQGKVGSKDLRDEVGCRSVWRFRGFDLLICFLICCLVIILFSLFLLGLPRSKHGSWEGRACCCRLMCCACAN
jgi:hypothetical protein